MKSPGVKTLLLLTLIEAVYSQCSLSKPCRFDDNGAVVALKKPRQYTSFGGRLSVNLNVDAKEVAFRWFKVYRRIYNDEIPGPTLRIKPGDTVTINLVNKLKKPQKQQYHNEFRYPNSTNLYFHGLYISNMDPQNNIFVKIGPEESHTYMFRIDSDQPAGTYWYHPILHGSSMFQVHSGMAGMIIVDDPVVGLLSLPGEIAAASCPRSCDNDIQLIFQPNLQYKKDWESKSGFAMLQRQIQDSSLMRFTYITTHSKISLESWLEDRVNRVDHFTTNGNVFPTYTMRIGYLKRFRLAQGKVISGPQTTAFFIWPEQFRCDNSQKFHFHALIQGMVNAGGSRTLELMITEKGSYTPNTGCEFREIAFDGVYLHLPRRPLSGSKTFIPPGGTADWLVACRTTGLYEIRSIPDPADVNSMGSVERHDELLFKLEVTGTNTQTADIPIVALPPIQAGYLQDFRSLTQYDVDGRFVVEAGSGSRLNRVKFANSSDFRFISELGIVQEWYLTNTDPAHGYPIHISTNHFQVISYNPYTGPVTASSGQTHTLYGQDRKLCHYQSPGYKAATRANLSGNLLAFLGHNIRQPYGGRGTLGYVAPGEFRSVIMLPPLANITVRFLTFKAAGDIFIFPTTLADYDRGMLVQTKVMEQSINLTFNYLTGYFYSTPGLCQKCDPFPFNLANENCAIVLYGGNFEEEDDDDDWFYFLFLLFILPFLFVGIWCILRHCDNINCNLFGDNDSDYSPRAYHKKTRATARPSDYNGSHRSSRHSHSY